MSKLFAAAALAVSIVALTTTPAHAQQSGQCPPGLTPSGPYCVTPGPVTNCPPGAQPPSVYCPAPPRPAAGGVAGFTMSEAEIAKLIEDTKTRLLNAINGILRRAGLPLVRPSQVVHTRTRSGFVVTITRLTVRSSLLLRAAGVPVAAVGCTVQSCPVGHNIRLDLLRRRAGSAAQHPRLYLGQRSAALRGRQVQVITVKVPRTRSARGKLQRARAVTVRFVTRTRDANGRIVDRTVKTIRVTLR